MVDKTMHKELGASPLLGAARADGGAEALAHLVLSSRDPLRELAWGLLAAGEPANGSAADVVETIIKEFDEADARAKAEEEEAASAPPEEETPETEAERLAREKEKEATRAQRARERALKRVDTMKDRLLELESGLATVHRQLRASEDARYRSRRRTRSPGARARRHAGPAPERHGGRGHAPGRGARCGGPAAARARERARGGARVGSHAVGPRPRPHRAAPDADRRGGERAGRGGHGHLESADLQRRVLRVDPALGPQDRPQRLRERSIA